MKTLHLTRLNVDEAIQAIRDAAQSRPVSKVTIEDGSIGKWSMSRLWRSWMASTAEWMAANGAQMPLVIQRDGTYSEMRPFNAEDAHELFTRRWLGEDGEGERLTWAKQSKDGMRPATKGERLHAMNQHQVYMTERGIQHMCPRESEYYELLQQYGS